MNNLNITLSQVRAALELKTQTLLAEWKLNQEKRRLSIYGYQTELNSKIINLPDVETIKKNQIEAMKAFGVSKGQVIIYFQLNNNYYGMYPCVPSDFIDYLTGKVDTKRRDFRVGLTGDCSVKGYKTFGFNYQSFVTVKASLVKELLLKWQDAVAEYLKYEEKFKKLTLFIKNLDAESQLVLLQLQHPEEHKNLIEYTENYLTERLTIS